MDNVKRLLERIDEELDRIPRFWTVSVVGDEKFEQWRQNVLDSLESFDEEYESKYWEDFNAIWQLADIPIPRDEIWEKDCFMESFHLLHKVRSELIQSATFLSLQPILNHYIRLSSLGECSDSELKTLLTKLENICAAEDVSIPDLARHGRIIAEVCAERIYHHLEQRPSDPPIKLDFNGHLREITGSLNGRNHGYIVSYLRLLQSCGNTASHPHTPQLSLIDGHSIVSASVRVLEYAGSL